MSQAMSPEMMEAAQKMMSKFSREDKERVAAMSKSVDPALVQQAWQMMSDPAKAQQAMGRIELALTLSLSLSLSLTYPQP